MLQIIFGSRTDKVTGEERKLRKVDLANFYSLPNVIVVIKLKRMRWIGHANIHGRDEKRI